jgi:DNA-binding CsgD family transcriptional regulator
MKNYPHDAGAESPLSTARGDSAKEDVRATAAGTVFWIERRWDPTQTSVGDELLRCLSDMWRGIEMGISPSMVLIATMDRIEAQLRAYLLEGADVDGEPSQDIGLTRREQQILQLIYEGLRPRAIAEELSLATYTVRSHIRNAARRMGVSGAYAAACAALEQGLIRRRRGDVMKARHREPSKQKYQNVVRKTPKIRVAS